MNKAALEQVAQWLEAGAPHVGDVLGFNMEVGVEFRDIEEDNGATSCGAVCCIAGAVCQFNRPFVVEGFFDGMTYREVSFYRGGDAYDDDSVFGRAEKILGITPEQAEALFTPDSVNWTLITPQHAAAVVRQFIETGVVEWRIANE